MADKLVPTKVPGIPPIPTDASPALRSYLSALGEALQVRLGRRGDPRDRAVTLRELVDSGLAKQLKARTFDPNVINSSNIGFETNITPNLAVPPAPAGLAAAVGFKTIILTWNSSVWPGFLYSNHSLTQVFRHTSDAIGDAVIIGTTNSAIFADDIVNDGTTYYYWVKYISTDNVPGPFNATSGVAATASTTNAITSTMITDDAITTPKLATNSVTTDALAAGAITADKAIIANAAIVTAQIADANITTAKIASAAITTAKIADANITTAKIADANITTAKIGSAAVDTLKIGGNAATVPQFATGSANNVAVTNAAYSSAIVTTNFTFSGLNSGESAGVIILVNLKHTGNTSGSDGTATLSIFKGGSILESLNYTYTGSGASQALFAFTTQANGQITYDVRITNAQASKTYTASHVANIIILGAKR